MHKTCIVFHFPLRLVVAVSDLLRAPTRTHLSFLYCNRAHICDHCQIRFFTTFGSSAQSAPFVALHLCGHCNILSCQILFTYESCVFSFQSAVNERCSSGPDVFSILRIVVIFLVRYFLLFL
ncbi:hypothetical protein D918_09779 [Trichuris suis]|nr:hypothetical protein D918_09779 [Trichuris suis]